MGPLERYACERHSLLGAGMTLLNRYARHLEIHETFPGRLVFLLGAALSLLLALYRGDRPWYVPILLAVGGASIGALVAADVSRRPPMRRGPIRPLSGVGMLITGVLFFVGANGGAALPVLFAIGAGFLSGEAAMLPSSSFRRVSDLRRRREKSS